MAKHSQAEFVAALFDPQRAMPAGVTAARGAADAVRLAVYRNNVLVSLTKALAQRFPVSARLVGQEFFQMMARAFVDVEKPTSPLIFAYGEGFPEFIETFEPADSLPYLADVARIERAWTNAYHAADAEPLATVDLAGIDADRLYDLALAPHPAAALIRSINPAGSIWAAHQGEELALLRHSGSETVLVVRPNMEVGVHIVPQRDATFAMAVLAGKSLGVAAALAAEANAEFDFGAALVGLAELGAFSTVLQPQESLQS